MDTRIKRKYESARANLLLVIIFTAVNMVLIWFDSGTTFLFSASLSQILVVLGIIMGMMGEMPAVTVIGIVLGLIVLGMYVLSYIFSKKKHKWMVFALIWFCIDWLALLIQYFFIFAVFDFSMIIDIVFHIWITIYLVSGVKHGKAYCENEMYDKTIVPEAVIQAALEKAQNAQESAPLRAIDNEQKRKRLVSAENNGVNVSVDFANGMTELIVNDFVYAEDRTYTKGGAFLLTAIVSGVQYVAVAEQRGYSFVREIYADGVLISKKK